MSAAIKPLSLSKYLFDLNPHYSSRATRNAHPLQNLEPNRIDARFIDRGSGLFVDMAAFVPDGNSLVTKCPRRWNHSDIYPFQRGTLQDVPVNIPHETTAILAREYGDLDRIENELPVIEHLRSLAHEPPPPMPALNGRGIVTTASDRYIPFLSELIHSLSRCDCRLPVEVWHRSHEIRPESIGELASDLVSFHVFDADHEPSHGFACKTAAVIASRFAEMLFLDADNSVLADPTYLFDHPAYAATGALLWPDQAYPPRREAELRRMLELSPQFTPMESGQLMFDKTRHWKGLHITNDLNFHHEFTYRFTHGDKDTFSMGLEMADEEFHVHRLRPQLDKQNEVHPAEA